MKKRIAALALAVSMAMGSAAFAASLNVVDDTKIFTFTQPSDSRVILTCYDENGILQYSNMYTSEDGTFTMDVPEQYRDMKKKVYLVDSKEFMDVEVTTALPEETTTPEATQAPEETVAPAETEAPAQTAKPTTAPSQSSYPSIYEKAVDAIYAPGVVKEVETREGQDGEVYAVTMLYHGTEVTFAVETEFGITTAPQAYSFMKDAPAVNLEEGDVICVTTNIAGDTVKTLDFITRPAAEDIVTGEDDYGTNFEDLISENGSAVAGKWKVMQYGQKPSSDRYQYAFGLVASKNANTVTLLNKGADTDEALEIDITNDTIVYTCDTANKNAVEIGSTADIVATVPKSMFSDNAVIWETDMSYSYALVRLVDGTATDIVLYNNYNE